MRFRVVQKSGREGVAGRRDGETWRVLFADETGFPGFPDDFVRGGASGIEAAGAAISKARRSPTSQRSLACRPSARRGRFSASD